jgi:hypothetical protein
MPRRFIDETNSTPRLSSSDTNLSAAVEKQNASPIAARYIAAWHVAAFGVHARAAHRHGFAGVGPKISNGVAEENGRPEGAALIHEKTFCSPLLRENQKAEWFWSRFAW